MKMMFNGLDQLLKLSNLRYGCETNEVLCFVKYYSLTHSLSIYNVRRGRVDIKGMMQFKCFEVMSH
jgi:hypothetical protein